MTLPRALLAALLLLLLAAWADARALTWTWDVPAPPPPADASYRFYYSRDAGTTWTRFLCPELGSDPALAGRLCTLALAPVGDRCYTVRAVSPEGEESANSNVLCYTFGPPPFPLRLRERTP